jgi:PrtD family type I secretion system ABC transporter
VTFTVSRREKPLLQKAISRCRSALVGVAMVSAIINILFLAGPLFMLEIYDRVLPSRSVPTLVSLLLILAFLYACQGVLDVIRNRILARIGAYLDRVASETCFQQVASPSAKAHSNEGLLALKDLDQVRAFFGSAGPGALFDLPWIPLYMLVCFTFHPWIGFAAVIGALVLLAMTLATDLSSRAPSQEATLWSLQKSNLAEAVARNGEAVRVMGMGPHLARRWSNLGGSYIDNQLRLSDIGAGFGALSKSFRMFLQSAILALSAYLFILGEVTSGMIVASGILVSRALAPVELSIAHWKTFVAASQSWKRLKKTFSARARQERLALPGPTTRLDVEGLFVAAPGSHSPLLSQVTFSVTAGSALAIIGPSAAGKSTLARALVGAWPCMRGEIRLDGTLIDHWNTDVFASHVGYLPQDLELFAGTVADNIARFDPNASADAVIAAAMTAGVHDMILKLPEGYETEIGEGGAVLSTGQRQRLGLARALFNQPFLVVLDEPNSSLDQVGEEALTAAIRAVRDRGGIVIVVAHRASALEACDQIMLISDGRAQMLERTRDVIRSVPAASDMNGKGRRINPSVAQAASELPQLIGEHHP